jgi:DNA-binding transcriptional LysR family regulator
MDLPQLRAFVALSETRHFGRAAALLHITQPALTKRLRLLETTFGAQLFKRDRAGSVLTPVGKLLLPNAIKIVEEANFALSRARHLIQGVAGRVDIGFGISTIDIAPRLVGSFTRAYPAVAVSLKDFSSEAQVERLLQGQLDVGFVRLPLEHKDLETWPIGTDRLALARPAGSELGGGSHNYDSLLRANFIMLKTARGPGLGGQVNQWCADAGVTLNITQFADDIQTVLALVAAGIGVSIVPHQAVRLMGSQVDIIPLEGRSAEWTLAAAWRRDHTNPALTNFIAMIKQEAVSEISARQIDEELM